MDSKTSEPFSRGALRSKPRANPSSHDDHFEGCGEFVRRVGCRPFGVLPEERFGVCGLVQRVEIDPVAFEGRDPSIDGVGDIDGVGGLRRAAECNEANSGPGGPSIWKEPFVPRITSRIEEGSTNISVVGVIPRWATPRIMVVDADKDLGSCRSDRLSKVAAKCDVVLDESVGVAEVAEVVHAYGGARRLLLGATEACCFGWVESGDAGLASGHQAVADPLSLAGPARYGARRAVFHVIGMSDDGERSRPIFGQVLKHELMVERSKRMGTRPGGVATVASMAKRKIVTVLNPEDEYTHEPDPVPNYNESMYLNGFDLEREVGAWFRIGNRVNEGYAEMTVCIYLPGGRVAFLYGRPEISNNDEMKGGWSGDQGRDALRTLEDQLRRQGLPPRKP